MKLEKIQKMNEICGAAYQKMYQMINANSINLSPFNAQNKEHLFIMFVAKGWGGILGKPVYLDTTRWQLWKINRKIAKENRYLKFQGKSTIINPNQILEHIRPAAEKEGITISEIYDEFYKEHK